MNFEHKIERFARVGKGELVSPISAKAHCAYLNNLGNASGDRVSAEDRGELLRSACGRVLLFADAETALSPDAAGRASTFLGAFTILLREGLVPLLIVASMIAFLRKAERREVLPYVHDGRCGKLDPRVSTNIARAMRLRYVTMVTWDMFA